MAPLRAGSKRESLRLRIDRPSWADRLDFHDALHEAVNDAEPSAPNGDQVIALAPYRIEHVDIPWKGSVVSGNLHLCPGGDKAPLVFYVPG